MEENPDGQIARSFAYRCKKILQRYSKRLRGLLVPEMRTTSATQIKPQCPDIGSVGQVWVHVIEADGLDMRTQAGLVRNLYLRPLDNS
jgi:hypothetical protein